MHCMLDISHKIVRIGLNGRRIRIFLAWAISKLAQHPVWSPEFTLFAFFPFEPFAVMALQHCLGGVRQN